MNTNQLKKFAQDARRKLLAQVAAQLEYVLGHDTAELREKAPQIKSLREELALSGKAALIEKVAYTWFNRLIALRFMDANDFQPSGIRILSPADGYTLPQLLDQAKQGHFPDEMRLPKQTVLDLLDGRRPSANPQNEAYRLLLTAACNALHRQFPFLFEQINDLAELLLPADLTSEFSIVHDVVQGMAPEDCQQVEVIGWLYQFYISEKKDEVFAAKSKVKKEDIPAATQLFTPRWIVEYMVQNTVGKLWLQNRPNSRLREYMPYFIESPSSQAEDFLRVSSPEALTLLDQACGSGHILVYAFELFAKIYEEEGYAPADIPRLILEKNLYGFEIDGRAAQLAGFSLLMKARGYYRRLFRKDTLVPNILQFQDLSFSDEELDNYFQHLKLDIFNQDLKADLWLFEQATNYGSLMQVRTREIPTLKRDLPSTDIFMQATHHKVLSAFRQMELLTMKFHCVVDNPPYMGGGKMNTKLAEYVKTHYPESKADLMACFMESAVEMVYKNGLIGLVTLDSWMFLSSFEDLRKNMPSKLSIDTMLHIGWNCFPEGHVYNRGTAFVLSKAKKQNGIFINLSNVPATINKRNLLEKRLESNEHTFKKSFNDFEKIPGSPIGYWVSNGILNSFQGNMIGDNHEVREGVGTRNDERFIRYCWEPNFEDIGINTRWLRTDKAGGGLKWYNQYIHLLLWENNGEEIKSYRNIDGSLKSRPQNTQFFNINAVSWGKVTSGQRVFRYRNEEFGFNDAAPSIFGESLFYILALLNSSVNEKLLEAKGGTINLTVGIIKEIPIIMKKDRIVETLSNECVEIAAKHWCNSEVVIDFQKNELLRLRGQDLEESYDAYCQYWTNKFHQLHRNEEELNRQFIEIYGLQDELTPDVPLEDITILKEETRIEQRQLVFDTGEVMAQFVSYAVGCMMGRYSLDKEGLILANQGETVGDYLSKVGKPERELSFQPDEDAIIPVLDDEWFEDDIVGRFHAFLKAAFGERDFRRNLAFLEAQLGKRLRKYFVKDFYADHIKRYKKRPIYWLFSSPKGSFSALVYLHRYTPDTLNNLLNHYLREFIQKLKAQRQHFEQLQISGTPAEQAQAVKRIDQLDKMLLDCEQYERDILFPLATERIALDLDDGVLVNYNKLGRAVKAISGLNDSKTKAKVRGFDWIDVTQIRD